MQIDLKFSRKTWYALLLFSTAAGLLNACAVLLGQNWAFLDVLAFSGAGMAVLFLAAEKSNTPAQRREYFFVFLAMLLGYVFGAPLGYVFGALAWPLLLFAERRGGAPVETPLRLTVFAEAMHLAFLLTTTAGLATHLLANLFWLLTLAARGAGALALFKKREDTAGRP